MSSVVVNIINGIRYNFLLSLGPTLLFLLVSQIQIYRGMSILEKIKGALFNLLVSFTSHQILIIVIFDIVYIFSPNALKQSLAYENLLYFCIVILVSCLYSWIYVLQIRQRNRVEGVVPIQKNFGLFIYSQYLVMIYVTLIFADTVFGAWLYMSVLYLVWYVVFKNDFDNMSRIYPAKINTVENACLFFQVLLIIMIYSIPQALVTAGIDLIGHSYYNWLKGLSIVEFIHCLLVHKVIYLQTLHRSNEIQNLCTDDLTGLSSRKFFMEDGRRKLESCGSRKISVVYINVSKFRYINQNYGNEAGDRFLKRLAWLLKEHFNDAIAISRLSDDRFGILLMDSYDIELNLLKCRNELVRENIVKDDSFIIALNAGVYVIEKKNVELEEALDYASIACESAICTNTVSVQYFDDEILKEELLQDYVTENLDRAISEGMLRVYYQPIVNIATEKYISAEALVRWYDDKHGIIPPAKFIPNLENQNMVYKVDCFVIEQICKDQRRLMDEGQKVLPISFNISKKDFFSVDMVDYVEDLVSKYEIPRSLLKVEITESAISAEDEFIKEQIQRFAQLGYKIWMDDFGSGYSSLNILGAYHFDGIKLDQAFLRNITPEKADLMRGVIHTAKLLGLEVLTEGVENSSQQHLLESIGCELAQGFKFCMPMSLEEHLQTSGKYVQK